jgi:hypothetical protein
MQIACSGLLETAQGYHSFATCRVDHFWAIKTAGLYAARGLGAESAGVPGILHAIDISDDPVRRLRASVVESGIRRRSGTYWITQSTGE